MVSEYVSVASKTPAPFVDPHRFGVLVRDSARLFRYMLRAYAEEFDLSFNQYLVLREVYEEPRVTQRVLGNTVGIAGPAIVAIVDALVARGFLSRERSQVDRREINLVLTREGRSVAARLVRRALEINNAAVRDMSEREAKKLRELLIRANANLTQSLEALEQPQKIRK